MITSDNLRTNVTAHPCYVTYSGSTEYADGMDLALVMHNFSRSNKKVSFEHILSTMCPTLTEQSALLYKILYKKFESILISSYFAR